jgi:hypothetical protein
MTGAAESEDDEKITGRQRINNRRTRRSSDSRLDFSFVDDFALHLIVSMGNRIYTVGLVCISCPQLSNLFSNKIWKVNNQLLN